MRVDTKRMLWMKAKILAEYFFLEPAENTVLLAKALYNLFNNAAVIFYVFLIAFLIRFRNVGFDSLTTFLLVFTVVVLLYKLVLGKVWEKYYKKKYY